MSHECAVLLHGDFAFYESGHAISKLVMFSMVVARLLIMVGEEAMISFSLRGNEEEANPCTVRPCRRQLLYH